MCREIHILEVVVNELEAMLAEMQSTLERQQESMSELTETMKTVRGRASRRDGLIKVETLMSGQLESLEIAPRAMKFPSEQLAEEILAAAKEATADAARQISEAMNPYVSGMNWDEVLAGSEQPDFSKLSVPGLSDSPAFRGAQETFRKYTQGGSGPA